MSYGSVTFHRRSALVSALCALALLGTFSGVAPMAAASTVERTGLFATDWKSVADRTQDEWDAAARNHLFIIGKGAAHGRRLDRMHALNPALRVLVYDLGPYLSQGTETFTRTLADHPEYFARDADGELITVLAFPHMVLMDQAQAGWRRMHASRAVAEVKEWGFDGVFVDGCGYAPTNGLYTTAVPINRLTGLPYTAAEWLANSVLTLGAVKTALPDHYVMYNGLTDGTNYHQVSKVLATSAADGGMSEGFVRLARRPITEYPSVADWRLTLDMIIDVEAKGQDFFGWTKTWTEATSEQQAQWNRFALATYLLGKEAGAYYSFSPFETADRATVFYSNQKARLGAPLGPYTILDTGVYRRRFANGVVKVDPAAHTASIKVFS